MEPVQGARARRWNWWLPALLLVPLGVLGYFAQRWSSDQRWTASETAAESRVWSEAEMGLRRWLADHPEDGGAWELLGHMLLEQERGDEALEVLGRVPETAVVWPHTQELVAKLMLQKRNLPEAERVMRGALARDSKSLEGWRQLSTVLVLERRLGEAWEVLRRMYELSREPRLLADRLLLGEIESEIRDEDRELEAFLRVTPYDPWLRRAWGMQLHARGCWAEALPYLEEAAERFEDDVLGRFALAECRMALGRLERDVSILGPQPARGVDEARWWVLRSRLEETWEDPAAARLSLAQALKADPMNHEGRYRLGQVLTRDGEAEAGKVERERAEEIGLAQGSLKRELRALLSEGYDAGSLLRIGRLCQELGLPEARDWLELSIRGDPEQDGLRLEPAEKAGDEDGGPGMALSNPRLREGRLEPRRGDAGDEAGCGGR